jgi:hypothetical protein
MRWLSEVKTCKLDEDVIVKLKWLCQSRTGVKWESFFPFPLLQFIFFSVFRFYLGVAIEILFRKYFAEETRNGLLYAAEKVLLSRNPVRFGIAHSEVRNGTEFWPFYLPRISSERNSGRFPFPRHRRNSNRMNQNFRLFRGLNFFSENGNPTSTYNLLSLFWVLLQNGGSWNACTIKRCITLLCIPKQSTSQNDVVP